jgi:hypothetical protein
MRTLQTVETSQVAGAAVVVGVNVPAESVKVGFTFFGGLVKVPFLNIDWSRFSKK